MYTLVTLKKIQKSPNLLMTFESNTNSLETFAETDIKKTARVAVTWYVLIYYMRNTTVVHLWTDGGQQRIFWSLPADGKLQSSRESLLRADDRWCASAAWCCASIDYFPQQQQPRRYAVAASCYCRCDVVNSIRRRTCPAAGVAPLSVGASHPKRSMTAEKNDP